MCAKMSRIPWSDSDCCVGVNVYSYGPLFPPGSSQNADDESSESASNSTKNSTENGSQPRLSENECSEIDNSMPHTPFDIP